jgi:hypothetical protein
MKKQGLLVSVLLILLLGCASNSNVKSPVVDKAQLPDTGQSRYFNEDGDVISAPEDEADVYFGQDAAYPGNELSYHDNGDGTVTDLNTGLMWQKSPEYYRFKFEEGQEYCEDLNLGGYSDWRMPTIKELYSLAYFNGELIPDGTSQPYIDTDTFDFQYDRLLFAGQYWSSTVYVKGGLQQYPQHGGIQGAFGFNFADGHIKSYETGYYFDGTEIGSDDNIMIPGCYVRAVRNTTSLYDMEYVDNGDGTVTDKSTGLMWAQDDSVEIMNWLDALDYAKKSELSGYSDWRLPSSKELQSLVDYEKETFPAINTDFFNTTVKKFETEEDRYWVWTGTTQGDFKYTACYVAFGQAWSKKNSDATTYYDWHGAGAQRSDPKAGERSDYELASEMASDYISISNYVRLVRDAE